MDRVPAGASVAVELIFSLSGISNVLLFLLTRPNLLLFGKGVETSDCANTSAPSDDTDSIEGGVEKSR